MIRSAVIVHTPSFWLYKPSVYFLSGKTIVCTYCKNDGKKDGPALTGLVIRWCVCCSWWPQLPQCWSMANVGEQLRRAVWPCCRPTTITSTRRSIDRRHSLCGYAASSRSSRISVICNTIYRRLTSKWSKKYHFRSVRRHCLLIQENWAIANMTAWCAQWVPWKLYVA